MRPQPLAAAEYPAGDDAFVTDLTFQVNRGADSAGGQIDVTGVCRTADTVTPLEGRLRGEAYRVTVGRGQQNEQVPDYPWQFQLGVEVPPNSDLEEGS